MIVPNDRRRAKEIFSAASELSGADRGAFVEESCGGDELLAAHVQSLLDALDGAGDFMANGSCHFSSEFCRSCSCFYSLCFEMFWAFGTSSPRSPA